MSGPKPPRVHPLKDNQARAVEPRDSVWLSASAGTGKTQVLSARVLRLLLTPGVRPENILCLTFTKAGAAEMATRVNQVLASWVRLEDTALAGQLGNIGAPSDPDTRARARTLFAHVLDCPGGGLRIDTIHAFAQWLLAAFPEEAGLVPGTRPMEDRDRELLAHRVLAELVAGWEAQGESVPIEALEALSLRLGPDKAREWLMRCAGERSAWIGQGSWQEPLRERVSQLLGLAADAGPETLAALCDDETFDCGSLRACLQTLSDWNTQGGREGAEAIRHWLGLSPAERSGAIDSFYGTVLNKTDRQPKQLANILKRDARYGDQVARVMQCLERVLEHRTLLGLVDVLTPALTVGRRFALAWDEAKQREGLVDFDDLIRRAAALLAAEGLGDWLRYKLDRQFDHILVDEAQDTNGAQWSIINALTEEFFAGEGQRDGKLRTIFVVGDYKQAIFRFQGTSPENFAAARARFAAAMADRAANDPGARELVDVGLGRSYRTAQVVLDFVDRAIAAIGPENFGLDRAPEPHEGAVRPGLVTLWKPVTARGEEDDDGDSDSDSDSHEAWLSGPERRMAERIAAHVKGLIGHFHLTKGVPRMAGPGDIMVLVRKRRELAGLIVARLHAAGVPVAGVDRLRLGAPLAVQDLLAAVRFAAQPLDDLSLANLLVSPLIGWSQDQLLRHGWRDNGHLWDHLKRSGDPEVAALRQQLDPLLARADYDTPQALLHWLLVGPWQGRRKLVARLGREANDPIDELLNAALAFSAVNTPSLTGFVRWFDAGEGELKREADGGQGLVRVMTVHGSKGLEAPIVILADATGNPDSSPPRGLTLTEDLPGGGGRTVPLIDLARHERVGPIAAAAHQVSLEERQEHWRLLYVAMTRAEEALFIGGALGKREKEPAPDSWYARLAPLFDGEPLADAVWGQRWELGERAPAGPARAQAGSPAPLSLPDWAARPVGSEPRPPRPLAPSSAGQELGADPPLPSEALALAARRGVLLHRLLERLPDVALADRAQLGGAWLARNAADVSDRDRAEMLAQAMAVIADPAWAELFSPAALAEVPLAATVGGQVIAGTADRLLIERDRVMVADFKTARRPPASLDQMPLSTLRQMGAYAAALGAIYPGRRIEAAVLYTQVPRLIAIPPELLAAHKPGLAEAQESFPG
ncbi:MAG: double-strand break repair helicase AddA [Croceibacterium sp.]